MFDLDNAILKFSEILDARYEKKIMADFEESS